MSSMALFELYPIAKAIAVLGKTWSKKRILFHCDNLATVAIIIKGRSSILIIMSLMRRITWTAATHNFTVHDEHVRGVDNDIADSISRFQMNRFQH